MQSLVEKSTVVKFGKDDVRPEKIRDEKRFVVIDILKKDGSVLSISQGDVPVCHPGTGHCFHLVQVPIISIETPWPLWELTVLWQGV